LDLDGWICALDEKAASLLFIFFCRFWVINKNWKKYDENNCELKQ
jgi:hypothetical protein